MILDPTRFPSGSLASPHDPEIEWNVEAGPLNWMALFGSAAPLVVEIGSGNGVFLAAEAEKHPELNYVGIERSGEFFDKLKRRLAQHGLVNARCLLADVRDAFARAFPPGGVSGVISNFSDPWPKRRHRERRVFRPEFLALLEAALAPRAAVRFKTDVGWYFNLTVTALRSRPGWRFEAAGPSAELDSDQGDVETNFERKAREAGSVVWGFTAIWEGSPS